MLVILLPQFIVGLFVLQMYNLPFLLVYLFFLTFQFFIFLLTYLRVHNFYQIDLLLFFFVRCLILQYLLFSRILFNLLCIELPAYLIRASFLLLLLLILVAF